MQHSDTCAYGINMRGGKQGKNTLNSVISHFIFLFASYMVMVEMRKYSCCAFHWRIKITINFVHISSVFLHFVNPCPASCASRKHLYRSQGFF